jgi:hypothetical protein
MYIMAEHVMVVASYCCPHKNICLLMLLCFCCVTNSKNGWRKWMMYCTRRKMVAARTLTRKGENWRRREGEHSKVALQTCWTTWGIYYSRIEGSNKWEVVWTPCCGFWSDSKDPGSCYLWISKCFQINNEIFILVFLEYQNMCVCFRCGNSQQSHLKRNRDAGAYNEYKFAGLTGQLKMQYRIFFDNAKVQ